MTGHKPRCGFPDCDAGELDITTIKRGDALRCVKNRWWVVVDITPSMIPGSLWVWFDDPHGPRWCIEVADWCSCKHRTAAELQADRLDRQGVQDELFGAPA